MAKISRWEGPSYEPEERENLEYVPPVVRRAEVGPMRRDNSGEGDESSDGTNSVPSTEDSRKLADRGTNNPSGLAPGTENPSEPTEETLSDVHSADGIPAQTETVQSDEDPQGVNAGKSQGEPEPQEKPHPPKSRAAARKAVPTKSTRAKADDDKSASVRFTDDDF